MLSNIFSFQQNLHQGIQYSGCLEHFCSGKNPHISTTALTIVKTRDYLANSLRVAKTFEKFNMNMMSYETSLILPLVSLCATEVKTDDNSYISVSDGVTSTS